jgi:hypothetical protein
MTREQTGARSAGAARLLAVVAVLVGLLAMHGLASTHHGPAAPGDAAPAHALVHAPVHDVVGAGRSHAAATVLSTAVGMPASVASAPLPACDGGDCPTGLAVMCLAVLTVVAAVGAAACARRATGPMRPRPARAPHAPAPRHLLRLLDPVVDLCVSRT